MNYAVGHCWANLCGSMGKNRPTPEEAVAMIKREPALMGFESPVFCAWWGEDGDVPPSLNTSPESDVPALAIHGQVDACCNIRWTELLSQTMPNLQRVELQAQGHVGSGGGCRQKLNDVPLRSWVFY